MKRIGIEPLFILELTWPAVDEEHDPVTLYFSDVEFTATDSPISGQPVHSHVQYFGQFTSVTKSDGFGSLESMEIHISDFFGLFKHTLENYNMYDLVGKLYLVVKSPGERPTIVPVLHGRVSDPMEWDETTRVFKLGFITNVTFHEFGFLPDWTEHDYLNRNLTGKPWPHVFGDSNTYEFDPICKNPTAILAKGIVIQSPGEDDEFYPYEDTDTYHVYHDGDTFTNLYANQLGNCPATEEGEGYWQIQVPGGSVLFKALNVGGALNMSGESDWNIPHYCNIVMWSPQQYNGFLPYQQDQQNYLPNSATLTGYGSYVEPNTFNLYGELTGWPGTVEIPFPMASFDPSQEPWLRGQYIYFSAFRLNTLPNDVRSVEYIKLWAKVKDQYDLNLLLDDVTDEDGNEFSLSGYRPCFIHFSILNKIFRPSAASAMCGGGSTSFGGNSQSRWPQPPIKAQRGKETDGEFIKRPDESELFDRIYHIKAGSDIKPVNWWPTMMYPISLDLVTEIQNLYTRVGRKLYPLDISKYMIVKYNKQAGIDAEDVTAAWEVVTGGLSGPPWIPATLWGMDYSYLPDECTFVILRPSVFMMMMKDLAGSEVARLLCTVKNSINTDERVFQFIVEKYTTMTATVGSDLFYHHPIKTMIQKNQSVTSIVGKLAWEHAKIVRVYNNVASLVDGLKPHSANMPRFDESNIEQGALTISYTSESEIKNRIEAQAEGDWAEGRFIVKDKESIARLTEIKTQVSIGLNRYFTAVTGLATVPPDPLNNSHWNETVGEQYEVPPVEEGDPPTFDNYQHLGRGYNRVLYYWLNDSAHTWMLVRFNTFLDSVVVGNGLIVGSDIVQVAFRSALEFIEATAGLPLNVAPVYRSGSLPQADGLVMEMSLNPSDWSISMEIKLPIRLGETEPRYVVEE